MLCPLIAFVLAAQDADFAQAQITWRKQREAALMAPKGWLSVAGLFWLVEGAQTIGSGENSMIRLPAAAPTNMGVVKLDKGQVSLETNEAETTSVIGKTPLMLRADTDGQPDEVKVGDLILSVIKRGTRVGIRMWDSNARTRMDFKGCLWFRPDAAYVVTARFTKHRAGKTLPITNVLGDTEPQPNPGYVEFPLHGQQCRLEALGEGDGLFFNFKDVTSGMETYAAGRFLNTDAPKDGFVVLDFNKAVNPPCAFTSFATCPLPPQGNTLKVRVEAGEKKQH